MSLKATKSTVLISASVFTYVGGVVTYALFGKSVYPIVGGWLSGILLMEGLYRRKPNARTEQNFPT